MIISVLALLACVHGDGVDTSSDIVTLRGANDVAITESGATIIWLPAEHDELVAVGDAPPPPARTRTLSPSQQNDATTQAALALFVLFLQSAADQAEDDGSDDADADAPVTRVKHRPLKSDERTAALKLKR